MAHSLRVWFGDQFELSMSQEAVDDMSAVGPVDDAVAHWAPQIRRPAGATKEALRAELAEHGAWDDEQLSDDDENWQRILWITACNIHEDDNSTDCETSTNMKREGQDDEQLPGQVRS